MPEVRARLLDLQREAIGEGGIVVEGRDIGSVVWPQAEVKVYLSADPDARAAASYGRAGRHRRRPAPRQSLLERDRIDSGRATAPLTMAEGAVHVDSTHLTPRRGHRPDRRAGRTRAGGREAVTRADLPASSRPSTRPPGCCACCVRPARAADPAPVAACTCTTPSGCPAAGGVILAANHIGIIDGPLLAVFAPRPVHALTKQEMFDGTARTASCGPPARSRSTGSTPTRRAIRSCLRVVRDGGVAGIFPEGTRGDGELHRFHHGAAYLALVTGAPVVPVTMLGTRAARRRRANALPARGDTIDLVFGAAVADDTAAVAPHAGTRGGHVGVAPRAPAVRAGQRARASTRRSLPGPLPAGQSEDDPDTGLVEPSREL